MSLWKTGVQWMGEVGSMAVAGVIMLASGYGLMEWSYQWFIERDSPKHQLGLLLEELEVELFTVDDKLVLSLEPEWIESQLGLPLADGLEITILYGDLTGAEELRVQPLAEWNRDGPIGRLRSFVPEGGLLNWEWKSTSGQVEGVRTLYGFRSPRVPDVMRLLQGIAKEVWDMELALQATEVQGLFQDFAPWPETSPL